MCDSTRALRAAQIEIQRCERAVAKGSPVDFWVRRLSDAAKSLQQAALLLKSHADALARKHAALDGDKP